MPSSGPRIVITHLIKSNSSEKRFKVRQPKSNAKTYTKAGTTPYSKARWAVGFPALAVSAPTYLCITGSLIVSVIVSVIGSVGKAATCISNLEAPLIPTHYDLALNASSPGKNDAIKNSDGSFKNVQSSSYIYPTALMPNYSKYIGSTYSTLPISNSEICTWT